MLWSCVITAACGLASALAPSYWWLVAARTGAGFALSALPICFTLMLEVLQLFQFLCGIHV
jgi:predicted MFS family arabinose efflux permease